MNTSTATATIKGNIYNDLVSMYDSATRSEKERITNIMEVRYNQGIYVVENWINEGGDPDIDYTGYDLDDAKHVLSVAGYVEGFEGQAQTWSLEERFENGETKYIDTKDIAAINTDSDAILYEVQKHFGGKYTYHNLENEGTLTLRIADHSGKHKNITTEEYLSIVIANDNATIDFYANGPEGIRNEYHFDSSNTSAEIIEFITNELYQIGVVNED